MEPEQAFSQLRLVLGESPDRQVWARLLALLKDWPVMGGQREMAVSYAVAHLDAWPDVLRVVPSWYWTELRTDGAPDALFWPLFRAIRFPARSVGDDEFQGLVRSGHLANITHLDLCTQKLTSVGLILLAQAEEACALEHLSLKGNPIGLRGMLALCHSHHLTKLKELVIGGEHMDDRCIDSLSQSLWLDQLEHFAGVGCAASEPVMISLLQSADWEALRSLSLQKGFLGRRWLEVLSDSPCFPRLQQLTLNFHSFPYKAWDALSQAPNSLTHLQLRGVDLDDRGLASLLMCDWGQLESLGLSLNQITDKGALLLAKHETFRRLGSLDMGYNKLSLDGIRALRGAPHLQETELSFL